MCRYVFMFALGAGPVPGLLLPEIFPDCIRAKGMAVAVCVHWVSPYRIISHTRKRHWGFMRHPNHAEAHMMVLGILMEAKRLVTAAIVLLLSSSHLVSLSKW
jgi:hypothetical protein